MLPLRISGAHLPQGIINEDIRKARRESIIAIEAVILPNANDDHLVVEVFP